MKQSRLIMAAAAALAMLSACGGSPGDTLSPGAATIDASTSPEDVVRSYLGALQDGDGSATALTTPSYGDPWTADPPRIEDVEVGAAQPEPTQGTAGGGHGEAAFVPVTFTRHGADETIPDGFTNGGYVLVRDGDPDPWRIADAGSI